MWAPRWKEAKVINLPKPVKAPKLPQNIRPISLLLTRGKLFGKEILKLAQRHIKEGDLHNPSQFGFRVRHNTAFQYIHVT
jgi:hypothetical protein